MDEYAFEAGITSVVPLGLVAGGLRLDAHFEGRMSAGALAGAALTGVDYLLLRPDGVAVVDAREVVSSDVGHVGVRARGFIVPPFAVPPLGDLLSPEFVWPDVDMPMHGSAVLQSGAPGLEALDRTVYGWTGAVNMGTGRLRVSARSLALASTEPLPVG